MNAEWFGYAGAVLMTSMSLPQIARIVRDRSAAGVSLVTWCIFAMSGSGWLAYGLILQAPAIIIGNITFVATTLPVVMLLLRTKKDSYARGIVMLGIALLPIVWTLVATQPMIMHAHFQYRILAVTMLGGMYFWLMSVDRNRLPDIRLSLPEAAPPVAAQKADDSAD